MRVVRKLGLVAAAFGASSLLAFGQTPDATQVLAAARAALGGEKSSTPSRRSWQMGAPGSFAATTSSQ